MAIVNHQNLEPEEAEITKYAFTEKELIKHLGWEGLWDLAIEHWQFQSWPFKDAPGECLICGKQVTVPFVYWDCAKSFSAHPKCIRYVAAGLLRDVLEPKIGREAASQWLQKLKAQFPE
jgi:hypothetical protein